MNRVILIKYGELTTKKGNRNFFVNTLYQNIKKKLANNQVKISKDISRMYIEFAETELDTIITKINKVFGIHTFHVAYKVPTDAEIIKTEVIKILLKETFKSFKVETKRSDKNFDIPSLDFSRILGAEILKNIENINVDVHNPELLLTVEVRSYYSYIYTNSYKGSGGYPVGTLGKGLAMLSGGIDSPVAFYLALKRGIKLDAVYFEAIPHTSIEARNKVINLCQILSSYTEKINLYIIPFTEIQEAIYKNVDRTYTITIMRRMMYRIMEKLVKKYHSQVVINGESVGQVASQTLTSMGVINNVTNLPVIRPVACFDKLEIIDISKKIGTYDISILPYEDCCTVFVPKHPIINPKLETAIKMENSFDYTKMIDKTLDNIEILNIGSNIKTNELL